MAATRTDEISEACEHYTGPPAISEVEQLMRFRASPFLVSAALSDLCKLCRRMETLSTSKFLLHPSKCRCLCRSYSLLLRHVLTYYGSLANDLVGLFKVLEHTLQEGECFLQNCMFQPGWISRVNFLAARKKQKLWLINKALGIANSTEIFDLHLHDFVWCISTLVWKLTADSRPDVRIQVQDIADEVRSAFLNARSHVSSDQRELVNRSTSPGADPIPFLQILLNRIWASADDEGDVKSMLELFENFKARGHEEICKLICRRLSDQSTTSNAHQLNLTHAVVPTYLLMDPPGFDHELEKHRVLSDHQSTVFETRLMGGRFACKNFQGPYSEEVFVNEAAIYAGLRHANVVHLVWCTRRVTSKALVMELMDGNLGQVIAKRRSAGMDPPFSLLAAVDLMLQIAKGMEYLHSLGIMHRDLKSFTILVRHSKKASCYLGEKGHLSVKVADFGTSKVNYDTSLFTTKRVGTSIWRAPEVLDDEEDEAKYTKKADVYSFAIVCSEILTGLPSHELLPCERRSELPKVLREGRRPKLPSSCHPAIARYIEKCWHGDASQRPTFTQICRVLRFFKACLLLGETHILISPPPDHMFDFEEPQTQSQGMFYPSVLGIPSEMHAMFGRLLWDRHLRPKPTAISM